MTHCLSCSVSDGPHCIHMFGVITALSQLVKISVLETGGEGEHREGGMEGEVEGGTDGGYLWLLQAPMRF